jgi:hypothetical protein
MQLRRKKAIDPFFDGHLEKDIRTMTAKEKLLYLSRQIELRHFIKDHVKRVPREKG